MRTVRDDEGDTYLLLKAATDSCLVRDPETGERFHLPAESVDVVGEDPLGVAARAVPDATRRLVVGARTDRALGLLVDVDDRGPLSVTEMLDGYDLCERDLHALLAEFTVAGLVEAVDAGGERAYRTTDDAAAALDRLTR